MQIDHSGYRKNLPRLLTVLLFVPVILACGATPVPEMTAPARDISLYFNLAGAYGSMPEGDYGSVPHTTIPSVIMMVSLFDRVSGGPFVLSNGQRLKCEGHTDPAAAHLGYAHFTLVRRPPGQFYTCIYTDERGVSTAVEVPVLDPLSIV
jgi:hypothetical protein